MDFGQTGNYGQYKGKDYVKTEWGWNVRYCRPATKEETFKRSYEVCQCSLCALPDTCHYSAFYCGREKEAGYVGMLERDYWKYRETLSEQKMAEEEIRRGKAQRDRNRTAVRRYAGND